MEGAEFDVPISDEGWIIEHKDTNQYDPADLKNRGNQNASQLRNVLPQYDVIFQD